MRMACLHAISRPAHSLHAPRCADQPSRPVLVVFSRNVSALLPWFDGFDLRPSGQAATRRHAVLSVAYASPTGLRIGSGPSSRPQARPAEPKYRYLFRTHSRKGGEGESSQRHVISLKRNTWFVVVCFNFHLFRCPNYINTLKYR